MRLKFYESKIDKNKTKTLREQHTKKETKHKKIVCLILKYNTYREKHVSTRHEQIEHTVRASSIAESEMYVIQYVAWKPVAILGLLTVQQEEQQKKTPGASCINNWKWC